MFKLKLHWQILIALVLGVLVGTIVQASQGAGVKDSPIVKFMEDNAEEFKKKGTSVEQSAVGVDNDQNIFSVIGSLIERMIPSNVIHAASDNGSMLSLIFVSLITAFGLLTLEGSAKQQLVGLIKGLNELMIKITGFIMKLAPIGVFGLMGWTISQTGPAFLFSMG